MALRIIFMGTPDFSVATLEALAEAGHEIVAVYSQPPRPAGRRGLELVKSPVHQAAERRGIPVFTPVNFREEADRAAFRALNAKRISMLTPYPQSVNDAEVRFCAHFGVEVVEEHGLNLPPTVSTASVSEDEWFAKMLKMKRPDVDAYFLSCTNIRAVGIIEALEDALDAPLITSNQAMLWHALRISGIRDSIEGFGALLSQH